MHDSSRRILEHLPVQFISSLFGDNGGAILTALFALGVVLVLIVLGVWLLKVVFKMSGSVSRGRNRRLSVIDTLQIDHKPNELLQVQMPEQLCDSEMI